MAIKIEMFSDFICPFCYIGFETVRKLKPEFDLEIAWRGFQIHPEWPAEGMPAAEFRREMPARGAPRCLDANRSDGGGGGLHDETARAAD